MTTAAPDQFRWQGCQSAAKGPEMLGTSPGLDTTPRRNVEPIGQGDGPGVVQDNPGTPARSASSHSVPPTGRPSSGALAKLPDPGNSTFAALTENTTTPGAVNSGGRGAVQRRAQNDCASDRPLVRLCPRSDEQSGHERPWQKDAPGGLQGDTPNNDWPMCPPGAPRTGGRSRTGAARALPLSYPCPCLADPGAGEVGNDRPQPAPARQGTLPGRGRLVNPAPAHRPPAPHRRPCTSGG
jgi:hypothetical protein